MAVRHNQGAVILVTLCQGRDRGYKGREGGGGGGGGGGGHEVREDEGGVKGGVIGYNLTCK